MSAGGRTLNGAGAPNPPSPIGLATRFFLTRRWNQSVIGPYVVTTAEVRISAFETTASWGVDGPQLDELFGAELTFDEKDASDAHEAMCQSVEREAGVERTAITGGHPSAA